MLSDHEIRHLREMGAVIIEPFRPEALNPNSYDLTMGPYIARMKPDVATRLAAERFYIGEDLYEGHVIRPNDVAGADAFDIEDHREDGEFVIRQGESILCHTNEFIGGTAIAGVDGALGPIAVNTQLRATSTGGRWNLTACRCAGHGDAGFFDRWTMETKNDGPEDMVVKVGSIISQLVFFRVATPERLYQEASGNYQKHRDLAKLMAEWKPERMLPKKLKLVDASFWKGLYS